MASTIILHVGAHKTGSTFLQGCLAASKIALADVGIHYVPQHLYWPKISSNYYKIENKVISKSPTSAIENTLIKPAKEIFYRLFEKISDKTIILSHEDFAGTIRLHMHETLYPAFPVYIGILMRFFDDFDVRFFLSIKNQADFLESSALQMVQQGLVHDPRVIIENAPMTQLSWSALVRTLESAVGCDNVYVCPSEIKAISYSEMTHRLLRFARADGELPDIIENSTLRAKNPSLTDVGLKIAMAALPHIDKAEWSKLRWYIQEHFSSGDRSSIVPANIKHLLRRYYYQDNADLLTRYGVQSVLPAYQ